MELQTITESVGIFGKIKWPGKKAGNQLHTHANVLSKMLSQLFRIHAVCMWE
jgi:hypothetical protein